MKVLCTEVHVGAGGRDMGELCTRGRGKNSHLLHKH